MYSTIRQLLLIQEKDRRISQLREDEAGIPASRQKVRRYLDQQQKLYEEGKGKLDDLETRISEVEGKLNVRSTTLTRMKIQLGSTRKQEEYDSLNREIAKYEQEVDSLETELLVLLDDKPKLEDELVKQEAKQREVRYKAKEFSEQMELKHAAIEEEISTIENERTELEAGVDSGLLGRYRRLLQNPGLPVVVQVGDGGQCGGCHVKVTPLTQSQAREGKGIVYCDNCGRMLY